MRRYFLGFFCNTAVVFLLVGPVFPQQINVNGEINSRKLMGVNLPLTLMGD